MLLVLSTEVNKWAWYKTSAITRLQVQYLLGSTLLKDVLKLDDCVGAITMKSNACFYAIEEFTHDSAFHPDEEEGRCPIAAFVCTYAWGQTGPRGRYL